MTNAEDLFAAALLQDIAIPLLLKEMPEQYEGLIERQGNERLRLSQLERELFGWDHAEAAASLVRNWRLPEEFAVLIERHPNFDELMSSNPPQKDAACVALAALLPSCRDEQWEERAAFEAGLSTVSAGEVAKINEILAEADATFAEFAPIMKLPVPTKSLQQWFEN